LENKEEKIISFINTSIFIKFMENETIKSEIEEVKFTSLSKNQKRVPYTISLHIDTIEKIKKYMEASGTKNRSKFIEHAIITHIDQSF
jgi:uncharacterized membrane-anchored protein YjiN (DUF445 family)